MSFYKGVGALAGCCLAGPEDVVAEVREWRGRMGGTLFGLWPGAASALSCLRRRLPRMPEYLARARAIDRRLWTWKRAMTTGDPVVQRVEFAVGNATMALAVDEIRSAVAVLGGSAS